MTNAKTKDPADASFEPFSDDRTVRTIGGLSLENGTARMAVHGSVDITRDKAGLAQARRLRETFAAIEHALERADLPEQVAEAGDVPPEAVKNPFA